MAPAEIEVAVVGAGAAGLAAAAELRAQGRSAVVLEARDRVGGRTRTDSATLRVPFDLGASYIHACEQGNPWADIALALGEPVAPDRRRRGLARGGGLAPAADGAAAYAAAANRAWSLIADAVAGGWCGAVGEILPRATEADRWVAALVGPWLCGADTAEVDAEDFIRARDGEDWLVPGGYGRLVARFGAASPVRLGCAVTAVRATARHVELRTDQGNLRAAHAIVTVPLGVLAAEQIRFDPPMPAGIADAIEALPMGNLTKIGIRFDGDPFGLGDTFYLHSRLAGECAVLYLARPHGRDMAVAFAGGGLARELAALEPEALLEAVVAPLAEMFGPGLRRRVAAWQVADWREDPFARGSYSVARPGMAHARAALREPFSERVHYAGEAAADDGWQATVAGAYLSGRAAARAILAPAGCRDPVTM